MTTGVLRLVAFNALQAVGSWRWLVVPPVFFVAGWLGAEDASYDYTTQTLRHANFWDAPLTMMTDPSAIAFAFVLGFVLVNGDLYVRDRSSGAAAMTLLRSRSRAGWWVAKVCALGPLALLFSVLAFFSALLAGAFRLPLSLQWSPASRIPWGNEGAIHPGFGTLPAPLFLLLVVLYTAVVLWAIGAVVVVVSTLYPHLITPLAAGLAWAFAGTPLVAPLVFRRGVGTLDPEYQLTYVIHFGNYRGVSATPWSVSFVVIAVTLALVLAIGAWQLRRVDL